MKEKGTIMEIKLSKGAPYGTPANQCNHFELVAFNNKNETLKEDLANLTANYAYSAIEFLSGERKGKNFKCVYTIILDFDEGMTLEEAKETFSLYWGYIATTKSHQQSTKGGEINGKEIEKRDRFRVILFLTEPIYLNFRT